MSTTRLASRPIMPKIVEKSPKVESVHSMGGPKTNDFVKKVQKRDGSIVTFDLSKITNAIYKAMLATGEGSLSEAEMVATKVLADLVRISKKYKNFLPTVEGIQDTVEKELILSEYVSTAKAYILYREKRAKLREQGVSVPEHVRKLAEGSKRYFRNPLAEFIFFRSYSRWMESEGRRETWIETVGRYISFMKENLGGKLTEAEYKMLQEAILKQEVMPSMRLMWSSGNAARQSNAAAYNCSFVAPTKAQDLAEIMYLSMSGCGVGFSVETLTAQMFPLIKRQTGKVRKAWIVEDSKAGWCDAFVAGLNAWFDGEDITFDYSRVRPRGVRLKTMGGYASGPEPLRELLVFSRAKIIGRQGKRLANIDVHDIICKIGEVVVAGGVRRTALISLSDLDDEQMRHAKDGQFYVLEPQRSMANNSAVYIEKPSTSQFMEEWLALSKSGSGERGIFNRGSLPKQLPLRRVENWNKTGYMEEGRVVGHPGTNPCVTKGTWIMTAAGPRQVVDLIGTRFEAVVDGKPHSSDGFFKTGMKKVFQVNTHRGFSFEATANHRVLTVGYKTRKVERHIWKEIGELKPGDRVVLHNHGGFVWNGKGTREEGWLLGNLYGDGNIEKNQQANLDYWGVNKELMMERAAALVHATVGGRSDLTGHVAKTGYARVGSMQLGALAADYGMTYQSKVPQKELEESSSDFYEGFLQGWFDADGSVQGTQQKGVSIRLSANSLPALEAAQRMLARLGIIAAMYKNRRAMAYRELPDGKGGVKSYLCQPNHELIVTEANIERFRARVGFSDPAKKEKLDGLLSQYKRVLNRESFSAAVVSIEDKSEEEVFDCTVPTASAFDGNGVYLHNCGEIILKSKQFCNLTEVVARARDTEKDLVRKARIASILGTYQSSLTNFVYLSPEWKKNCEDERLLGVSITGQWDCEAVRNPRTLARMKEETVKVNREYAKRFKITPSTSITCVKPSGTVSQLVDASSGMHPRHSKYYIRRVRISATDPLFHMLRDQGVPYHAEVGQTIENANTYVLEFPVKAPAGSVFKDDLTALEQLEHWKTVKENFTEHNPSVTVSVGEGEWIETANWLYANWDMLGGLSFLPRNNHVYKLAPYEETDEKTYAEMTKRFGDIDFSKIVTYEKVDATQGSKELACVAGVCEI